MKTGEAYWGSNQQRALDLVATAPARPVLAIAKALLRISLPEDETSLFYQKRVGTATAPSRLFEIEKLHTSDPGGRPFNLLSAWYRKLGIDELAQISNIRRGEMSVCGWRPTIADPIPGASSYDEIMDSLNPALQKRWGYITANSKPGVLSSYSLYEHSHSVERTARNYELRAEMDIQDAVDASLVTDTALIGNYFAMALSRKLVQTN